MELAQTVSAPVIEQAGRGSTLSVAAVEVAGPQTLLNSARNCLRESAGLDVRPLTRLFIGQPPPDCALDRPFAALCIVNAESDPV